MSGSVAAGGGHSPARGSAPTSNQAPTDLLDPRAAVFVRELATGIDFVAACQRAGCSPAEATLWEQHPSGVFLRMLQDAKEQTRDAGTTAARIKIRAQRIVEDKLDTVGDIIADVQAPPAARVSAFSSIKTLTGLDAPKDAVPAQSFKLNIILPGADGPVTIEGAVSSAGDGPTSAPADAGTPDATPSGSDARNRHAGRIRAAPIVDEDAEPVGFAEPMSGCGNSDQEEGVADWDVLLDDLAHG